MTTFLEALEGRLRKLDDDYKRHRNALVMAIDCERGTPSSRPPLRSVESPPRPLEMMPLSGGELIAQKAIVKLAIESLVKDGKTEFTKTDVITRLEQGKADGVNVSEHTLKNIASFLWRFHKDEDRFIEVKEKGQGHKQSVYVLANRG